MQFLEPGRSLSGLEGCCLDYFGVESVSVSGFESASAVAAC